MSLIRKKLSLRVAENLVIEIDNTIIPMCTFAFGYFIGEGNLLLAILPVLALSLLGRASTKLWFYWYKKMMGK